MHRFISQVQPVKIDKSTESSIGQLSQFAQVVLAKDGAGWGFGLGAVLIAGVLWNLGRKIDPIAISLSINNFIRDTHRMLNEILTSNRSISEKIEDLRMQMQELRALQKRNQELNLGMSGDLRELEYKVDNTIKEISRKI